MMWEEPLRYEKTDANASLYSSLATRSFSSTRSPFKRETIAVNDRYLPELSPELLLGALTIALDNCLEYMNMSKVKKEQLVID